MSQAQIEANRRNAQKSTGPKTPAGRAVSKMNALKHGMLSQEALVRGFNIKENARELAAVRQRFLEELNPIGPVEEMLVDQMVTTKWRMRRALTAERGEIALSVDEGHWRRSRRDPRLLGLLWQSSGDRVNAMLDSVLGNSIVARWLRDLRKRVEQDGELTEEAIKSAFAEPTAYSNQFEELRLRLAQRPEGPDAAARRETNKKEALDFIDRQAMFLHWEKIHLQKREAADEEARQAAAVLPSVEVLEKILRYETKLEKQLYRAMNHLERLQRMRRGEAVPPPVSVEVSERP